MNRSLTLYADRDSGLHRAHPLTTLSISGTAMFCGLLLPGTWSSFGVALLVLLPLSVWGRIAAPLLSRAWRIVLPFAVSVFLIQGLFWHGGTVVLHLGPLSLKREGLLFAAQATGRIVVVVFGFLLLSLTTRPDALMIALSRRGLPSSVTYIVLATVQIVPQFRSRASTIVDAQRARGLETGGRVLKRLRGLLPLVGPLVLGSIVEVEQRAMALEARAFSRKGPKTSMVVLLDDKWQRAVRILMWGVILGSLGARVVSLL